MKKSSMLMVAFLIVFELGSAAIGKHRLRRISVEKVEMS